MGGGFGGGGFGGGGFGSGGFGGSVFGGGGGFGMGGYGGGQAFVGRDSGDMAAVWNETGRGGRQSFGQSNRNFSRPNRNRRPAQSTENVPQPMNVELEVAFDVPRPAPAAVLTALQTRLGKILGARNIAQPNVMIEGDTAVLRGVASSESERLVLEKLVSLEPGVRNVRNEITVSEPSVALPPQPAE